MVQAEAGCSLSVVLESLSSIVPYSFMSITLDLLPPASIVAVSY